MNKQQDDQSGDFEYWEERDEKQHGDIWNRNEWDTDEHLTPPHGIYRRYRPRRKNVRPIQRQWHTQPLPQHAPTTQPSLRRIPKVRSSLSPSKVPPTPRRSNNQSLSYRAQNTQPSMNGSSNYPPSSHGRTKFHFPGGRRGIAILVGLLGTALLLGGIYNLALFFSSRAYTPLGANQTLVEQVCVVHAEANDTFITPTLYDQEQNLSSTHSMKIHDTGNTFTAQLEITHIPIPWFLNWLGIPNGYQVSNNMNQPLVSNNWLLQTSSVPVTLKLDMGNQQINLYNLVITAQGASFQPAPHPAGKCN